MTSEIPLEDWTIRDFDIKNVSGDVPHTPKLNIVCLEEELPLVHFHSRINRTIKSKMPQRKTGVCEVVFNRVF